MFGGHCLTPNELARFEAKVERVAESGCWIWLASLNALGYARFRMDGRNGSQEHAHRPAYEHWRGRIAEGLELDHLCRVRCCVNPWHLEPVTGHENLLRSPFTQASINRAKTHCPSGHAYADTAVSYASMPGARVCAECARARALKYYYRSGKAKRAARRLSA